MTDLESKKMNLAIELHKAMRKAYKQQFKQFCDDTIGTPAFDPYTWQPDWQKITEDVLNNQDVVKATETYEQKHLDLSASAIKNEVLQEFPTRSEMATTKN